SHVISRCFFLRDTSTTEIYTLSLHDALPISARDSDGAHEVEGIEVLDVRQRRAGNAHQLVDRHTVRMLRQVGQLAQHADAVTRGLAHADDAAAAHLDAGFAHVVEGFQTLVEAPRGDDLLVVLT